METEDNGGSLAENHDMYTSMSVLGKRGRPTMDAVEPSDRSHWRRGTRYGAGARRPASVAET